VILLDDEMSDRDATRVAALHRADESEVVYHLLISALTTVGDASTSLLGVRPADTFGSSAVARLTGAHGTTDRRTDLSEVMEHSARRIRATTGRTVNVAVTHGELLRGGRTLVATTGSQDAVLVASSDAYSHLELPEWQHKACTYLSVQRVHFVAHSA